MIKFFRKIRQQLLSENKFSKYLIYAIGEIVLVVIGILIALGINNWKENQEEIKQQNLIFENLSLELNNNLKNLNSAIKFSETYIYSSDSLLRSMNNLASNKFKGEKLDSLLSKFGFSQWKRTNLNIKSLENSGRLNTVQNSELKRLIYDWLSLIEDLESLEKRSNHAFQYYVDFIKKNGSWREIDKYMIDRVQGSQLLQSNDHLLLSSEFENCVNDLNIFETHKYNRYLQIRVTLNKLIEYTE
ncbi:DUF6090 family protein [Zeaxanthinibacter sp. PT1]|uniref:DUF6090 family protein n=1 Tax=Zeaxanthinibacter TaxID=561554 RepID=UPI00234AA066|nr:DUF6090 family protein [Zeaxanthinibacter sp. PT1]MDC6350074.1 DUF6090 family protein [Zeaxanthinibacter sp. PT1]